jgi:hypothetical protein
MKTYKKKIFSLFFLLYVFIYAVSPLIFTFYCENNTGPHAVKYFSNHAKALATKSESVIVAAEKAPSDGSAFWVLVKKKRALLPDDTVEEELQPHDTIVSQEIVLVSHDNGAPASGLERVTGMSQEHHPLFRSNSPPRASSFLTC